MKISIWQQFSSNHSSRFTVVGMFESPEAAQKAADILKELAAKTLQWYMDDEDAQEAWESGDLGEPTPAEVEFAEKYGVDWGDHGHDWAFSSSEHAVTQVDNLIFINGHESDYGARPLDEIIEKLGGEAKVDGTIVYESDDEWGGDEEHFTVAVNVTCLAPNLDTASEIEYLTEVYLNTKNNPLNGAEMFDTPWRAHGPLGIHTMSAVRGGIRRDGLQLYFDNLKFFHIGYGLPGLLKYLKDKGCTKIEYTLIEEEL